MKALVTQLRPDGIREKVLVYDWPEPPDPVCNQVKTKTLFTGVTNGTERNDLIGGNYAAKKLPFCWGYQNVGEVIEVGPDCKTLKVGDIVFSGSKHQEYSTFAEDWLVVKIPDNIDLKEAALYGMASVAMRTCRHADPKLGSKILVVGAGFIGQICLQIFNAMGSRVWICDIDEKRLETARNFGCAECVFNSAADGWRANVTDYFFDIVVDVAGVPGMEDRLIEAVRCRGSVLFIAGRSEVKYTFNNAQFHEVNIKQNSHFDRSDLEELLRLSSKGIVKIGPMIQDVVPVTEAKRIYDILRDNPAKLFGTVFQW